MYEIEAKKELIFLNDLVLMIGIKKIWSGLRICSLAVWDNSCTLIIVFFEIFSILELPIWAGLNIVMNVVHNKRYQVLLSFGPVNWKYI